MAAGMIFFSAVYSQVSIDALFEKYAGNPGFTTVTINGGILGLLTDKDEAGGNLPGDVTMIRILSQEDPSLEVENFYEKVIRDLDLSKYEEFMTVKEKDQDVRMLVRTEGDSFREFLLITGGDDNAIIQIKGNMSFEEAKRFSENARENPGEMEF